MAKRRSRRDTAEVDAALLVQWIRKTKRGDLDAFQEIYNIFARRVFNFIYRMVNSVPEAEDLTQETFVTVFRKIGTLKENLKFEPWLFRIARNYVYQRYRSRTPAMASLDQTDESGQELGQLTDPGKNPDEEYQSVELREVVRRVISELSPKYREVFVLSAIRNLRYEEIAEIVGRSLASVKTDIHRARLQVRERVKGYLTGVDA